MTDSKFTNSSILLVVDDEQINTLCSGLCEFGYQVTTFTSAREALKHYKLDTPDLVITDYRMPDIDGMVLVREMIQFTQRPIIMLSAFNDLPRVRKSMGTGFHNYLVKPVEAERVASSIEASLDRFTKISTLQRQGVSIKTSIESQRLISTAVGIVMVQTQRPQNIAFESLRRLARNQRRSLRDLAFDLVDSTTSSNRILSQLRDVR